MYSVRFYRGNSLDRQQQANDDNCTAFFDLQFNLSKDVNLAYTSIAIASNANEFTKRWARNLAFLFQEDLGTSLGGNNGILIGGRYSKNEADLIYANMPAIIGQPLFASNQLHISWIKKKSIQLRLARIIAHNIYSTFPNGGLFAFGTPQHSKLNHDNISHFNFNSSIYTGSILRKASMMIHSQIGSSISSYKPNVFTSRI